MVAERDLLFYAGLTAQIGIALASLAAIVRWLTPFIVGVIAGAFGIGISAYASRCIRGCVLIFALIISDFALLLRPTPLDFQHIENKGLCSALRDCRRIGGARVNRPSRTRRKVRIPAIHGVGCHPRELPDPQSCGSPDADWLCPRFDHRSNLALQRDALAEAGCEKMFHRATVGCGCRPAPTPPRSRRGPRHRRDQWTFPLAEKSPVGHARSRYPLDMIV